MSALGRFLPRALHNRAAALRRRADIQCCTAPGNFRPKQDANPRRDGYVSLNTADVSLIKAALHDFASTLIDLQAESTSPLLLMQDLGLLLTLQLVHLLLALRLLAGDHRLSLADSAWDLGSGG